MLVRDWAVSFAATLLAESPIYLLSSRRSFRPSTALVVILLLNLATHPVAWTTFHLGRLSFPYGFFLVEAAVVVAEALLFFAATRSRWSRQPLPASTCLAISFAANSFSAGLGLILAS